MPADRVGLMQDDGVQLVLDFVRHAVAADDGVRAIDALYLGLRQFPRSAELLRELGRVCRQNERLEEAHEAYLRLKALLPHDTEVAQALTGLAGRPREIATSPLTYGRGRVRFFSIHKLFSQAGGDGRLWGALGLALMAERGLALYGNTPFLDKLLDAVPEVAERACALIVDDGAEADIGIPVVAPDSLPPEVTTVFLCETRTRQRHEMLARLPSTVRVIDAGLLAELPDQTLVAAGWTAISPHIYPMAIPPIEVRPGLDVLVLDCPARNLALVPNGLGFVSNALARTDLTYQILDSDIICYHRYQIRRLFDEGGVLSLSDGRELPADPWAGEHSLLWENGDILELFEAEIEEVVAAIVAARPKVLGLSVHGCNTHFSTEVVRRVRERWPEVVVVCGGFNCYNPDIGLDGFPSTDYMCIGEADLTIGPLCEALARGERPIDVPGVISRFDTPGRQFVPGPLEHNLDRLGFPKYEWASLRLYRGYNGYHLTPIIASRGCRWSRCTFCAERFYWRIRGAKPFVDEVEWLMSQGCRSFMFSESDLNGLPERLLEICDEIIRRGLEAAFIGQLRISPHSDRAFFDKLAAAGFTMLRFGVDAFSANTLKLQKKGYTLDTVRRNIRDCASAGISVTLNWVIGVPGETEADLDEGLNFLSEMKPYLYKVENINPLIMANGSMYWLEPEQHNIRFARPKEELYRENRRFVDASLWWSEEPFIDADIRTQRFERVVTELDRMGVPISKWTKRVVDDIREGRDAARTGRRKAEQ